MPARPGASLSLLCIFLAAFCGLSTFLDRSSASARTGAVNDKVTQGQLQILDSQGKPGGLCPLKHTEVKAEVSGFLRSDLRYSTGSVSDLSIGQKAC